MPFEIMDQRGASASSHFFEEIRLPIERQIGFWKTDAMPGHEDGMVPTHGSKLGASSPLGRAVPFGALSVVCSEMPPSNLARETKGRLGSGVEEGIPNLSKVSQNSINHHPKSWSNLCVQPASYSLSSNRTSINGIQRESSLFSSSLSEIFTRKLSLRGNDVASPQLPREIDSHHEEEEPFESLEEIEAQTIGNLLPDEDDLFSGVIDVMGQNLHASSGDELEDFDLFSSCGGLELESDGHLWAGQRNSNFTGNMSSGQEGSNGSLVGQHPHGEHPSRTLFVRNINGNVEDSEIKALFEKYGEIRTLYTSCKHRGFVMISYYDIRAALNAMRALQNMPMRQRKLDIHYSSPKGNPLEQGVNQGIVVVFTVDSSVTTDDLHQLFGAYGEIKEIRESAQKRHQKIIQFYDIRAAENAFHALNRGDIAGKHIKLDSSCLGNARQGSAQAEQEQDKPSLCQSSFNDLSSGRTAPAVIGSSCIDDGAAQLVHAATLSPVDPFIDSHHSSSVPNNMSFPTRITAIGRQSALNEQNHSLDEMKFGNQGLPSLHPHSLPEYYDSLANGIPYKSSCTIVPDTGSSVGHRMTEGLDNRRILGVPSNGHLMELNGRVFGSSGSGSCSLHGNRYMWNNSNSHQHHTSSPIIWPNSPSFVNGVHAHHLQHAPGFPRVPIMMNATSPVHHHIGSAPAVNSSRWDRHHTHSYAGESPGNSSFHLGSIGSVGFPGSSPSNPMEIASHNVFSHAGQNCMDMMKTAGLHSPQQMCHMFPGRNPLISVPASFDSPNERVRNLHRRNESNASVDKKQYELDIDRILCGEDSRTTLMIKNIPNKYTSKMLLAAIDEHCRGTYDFIYLPIDFKNKCNVGYAFINIIDPRQIVPFHKAFNGKKWEKFNSEKVASLAYARIQGKAALIAHFQNSSLMNEDKRCRPILFHTDGPNAGDQEPFPMGTNIRSRPGKTRNSSTEENHRQGSPPANRDESSNRAESSSGSSRDSDSAI